MLISYNWLQSFFKKRLPKPKKLVELLTFHSFEVKELKKEKNDYLLDIDILPNRMPDCFSYFGMARECGALTNSKFEIRNSKLREDKNLKAKDFLKIEVKDKAACPRYTARVICDVKVDFSPEWLRERLKIGGLRPVNNIVDIVNYVMLETGQPLHAFDFDKIESLTPKFQTKKLIVRFARKGEKITTLDEEKYDLDKNILVIADAKKPVAIAGIKGGRDTGIDFKTKVIVLESANFNSQIIRQGSKRINLKTDASWRFEHGIDLNLTELAINRAAYLIKEIGGGKITQGLIDFYPEKVLPRRIKLDLDYVKNLLGVKIPEKEIKRILTNLGFKIKNLKSFGKNLELKILDIEVPTFRLDISIPEDLIEEIGRISGYQKIPATFPVSILVPAKRNEDIFWEDFIKNILKETSFTEVYNYSFVSQSQKKIFRVGNEILEIKNPVSLEQRYLRPSLIPNLIKNIKDNFRYYQEVKIFELGKIYKNSQGKIEEKRMLTGLIGKKVASPKDKDYEFYELKGVVDSLLEKIGIANIWYDDYKPTPEENNLTIWRKGKCAEIKTNGQEIGFLGEIQEEILEELGLSGKIVIFDIDFEKLQKLANEEQEYRPISKYPATIRDISLFLPREVLVEDVLNKIYDAGGPLIRDVDLFDIYESEEIGDRKSLAFHLVFQAEDRTLESSEVSKLMEKIIETLEKEPNWEVRK